MTALPRNRLVMAFWPPKMAASAVGGTFEFKYDGSGIGKGGIGTLFVDDKQIAQGRLDRTVCRRFSLDETFDVGADTGSPLIEDYAARMPFKFTGRLEKLTIELDPHQLGIRGDREA